MNTTPLRIALAATAVAAIASLALFALYIHALHALHALREPLPAEPARDAFAARFQPDPDVVAGIGSTRELRPVPLDGAPTAPETVGDRDRAPGAHHGRQTSRP